MTAKARRPCLVRQARAVAVRTRPFREERRDARHALFILHFRERILDRVHGIEIREIHLAGRIRLFIVIQQVILFCRPVEHEVFFPRREVAERHVRANADMVACDVFHQRPHELLPRRDRALVDCQRIIWHELCLVDRAHDARALARLARAAAVEREVFRARPVEMYAARRADDLAIGRDVHGRRHHVPVRAAVTRETRKHEAQAVQQFRHRAERAADARHARPLPERECRRHIADLIDIRKRRLCHAPPRIRRQCLKIPPRALGIQHAERERRLPRPRHAGDADDLMQRDVEIEIPQVMHMRSTHFYRLWLWHKQFPLHEHRTVLDTPYGSRGFLSRYRCPFNHILSDGHDCQAAIPCVVPIVKRIALVLCSFTYLRIHRAAGKKCRLPALPNVFVERGHPLGLRFCG